jgi:hypothetical protein
MSLTASSWRRRHAFEQDVTVGEQRDQKLMRDGFHADDDPATRRGRAQPAHALGQLPTTMPSSEVLIGLAVMPPLPAH